jgi:hypothetical protein
MGRVGLGFGKGRTKEPQHKTVDSVPAAALQSFSLQHPIKYFPNSSVILQTKSNTDMNTTASENEVAMIADFRKVINTLNSSTLPEHLVATQRLWELLEKKWTPFLKSDIKLKENLKSFTTIYESQKRAVANKLEILG